MTRRRGKDPVTHHPKPSLTVGSARRRSKDWRERIPYLVGAFFVLVVLFALSWGRTMPPGP